MSCVFAPSLLSADFFNLEAEIRKLENAGVKWLHLDIMDGDFVPNITFGAPVIKSLRKKCGLFFDVHLMINQPERHLEDFVKAGSDLLVVHIETLTHAQKTLDAIHNLNVKAGVSLNPGTDFHCLRWLLPYIDLVLVMGVNPGFSGQKFLPETIEKITECRKYLVHYGCENIPIEVDGGVCKDNICALANAGADVLVSGSAFFNSPDYRITLDEFNREADKAKGRSSFAIVNSWEPLTQG